MVLITLVSTQGAAGYEKSPYRRPNFFRLDEIEHLKIVISAPSAELQPYVDILKLTADSLLMYRPWSVMFQRCPDRNVDPHDYYSESTYWWPDPGNPDGPYIRKDGIRNPDRFTVHKEALTQMSVATFTLGAAAYLFENEHYAEKAREFIRVWFLDLETRMNPNARYAQVIPNSDQKRGVGIIDTRRFAQVLESVAYLKMAGYWDEETDRELQIWFREYLDWLLKSEYGLDEKQRGNNHSSWYAFQIAVYARYVGDENIVRENWNYCRDFLIEGQIEADGSMPLEMERTRSLFYFTFNLDVLSLLARMAEEDSIDLWRYNNSKGGSIQKSVDYIMPYIENPQNWVREQIYPFHRNEMIFLLYCGEALHKSSLIHAYRSVQSWRVIREDPFIFLLNIVSISASRKEREN